MAYFIEGVEYTKEEFDALKDIIKNSPESTFETIYRLNHETRTYEAFERTEEEKVQWYVDEVLIKGLSIDEVPTEYREAVQAMLPVDPEQEVIDSIMEEVSGYEY